MTTYVWGQVAEGYREEKISGGFPTLLGLLKAKFAALFEMIPVYVDIIHKITRSFRQPYQPHYHHCHWSRYCEIAWGTSVGYGKRENKRKTWGIPPSECQEFYSLLPEPEYEGFSARSPKSSPRVPILGLGLLRTEKWKLKADSVVLQILVFFPNLPTVIYFSQSSNAFSMHSVRVA